jgi:hypothetical protein
VRILVPTTALALALSVAAASAGTPGGLRGKVLIEPGFPVCRAGEPCTRPASHVWLVFSRGGRPVKRTRTGDDGSYRVTLAAGAYGVSSPGPGLMRELEPDRVVVPRGLFRRVVFKLDIGIR